MKKYRKIKQKTVNLGGFKIPYLLFAAGIIVAAFKVFLTVQSITSSAKLVYLENEEYKLIKSNEELNSNLIENSSLSNLANSAESLGFIEPSKTFYSEADQEMAKLP
jgi:hypothetical protein